MTLNDFRQFMLLTEQGLGEDKVVSFHNKPLDLQLYVVIGYPFDCNSPNGIWTFIVTKAWLLESINRIINASCSNNNIYTLKNIKGTKEKVPAVTNDLVRDIKKAYIVNNPNGNERYIETTQFEFQSIIKKYVPALKAELESRLKNKAIGADIDRNFNDQISTAKECIDILQPWSTSEIKYAEQKASKDACYGKLMKLIHADATLEKMYSLCNIFYNGVMRSPTLPLIGEAYDKAIQSVMKQGVELYDICIGVQPNSESTVYEIKAITAKPKEFANWLKSEKYKNSNIKVISCNRCNGTSVTVENKGSHGTGSKPTNGPSEATNPAKPSKVSEPSTKSNQSDSVESVTKVTNSIVNNPITRFIGRTMTRQFWREFWRSVFR